MCTSNFPICGFSCIKRTTKRIDDFRNHYLEARNLMCKRLDELPSVFSYQKPRESYLMFPKILIKEGKDSVTFCKKLLRDIKVSTTPSIVFGFYSESSMRLSFFSL